MGSLIKKKIIIFLLLLFAGTFTKQMRAQQVMVSVQVFYDELSPYGHWVNYPNYGYVWIPVVGYDFFPYGSHGHWVYTIYGWTWVSYYSWGWAPFHYGRWDYDPFYGWFWVPDIEWGPAWVIWRRSPGYYGWTYLRPGHNHKKLADNTYYGPRKDWTFVEEKYIGRKDAENYYAPRTKNESLINNSTVINKTYFDKKSNTTYITGPGKEDVEKSLGAPVKEMSIEENVKPSQAVVAKNKLNIYRPTIVKTSESDPKPAPAKVVDLKDVKPVSERKVTDKPEAPPPAKVPAPSQPVKDNVAEPSVKPHSDVPANKPQLPEKKVQPEPPVKPHTTPKIEPVKPKSPPPPQNIQPRHTEKPNINPKVNQPKPTPPVKQVPVTPKVDPPKQQNVPAKPKDIKPQVPRVP